MDSEKDDQLKSRRRFLKRLGLGAISTVGAVTAGHLGGSKAKAIVPQPKVITKEVIVEKEKVIKVKQREFVRPNERLRQRAIRRFLSNFQAILDHPPNGYKLIAKDIGDVWVDDEAHILHLKHLCETFSFCINEDINHYDQVNLRDLRRLVRTTLHEIKHSRPKERW